MRLDLFLKHTLLVKRRTLAREMCENGRVLVNKAAAKPAKDVRPGDIITLKYAARTIDLEVLGLPEKAGRAAAGEIYRFLPETRNRREADAWNDNPVSS